MNSILIGPVPPRTRALSGRILAIEPDADRAAFLREVLRDSPKVALEIVARTEGAIRSMRERVPDLILTSTFYPPAEEAELASHVRALRGASHVQIICVPYVAERATPQPPRGQYSNVLRFVKRRTSAERPQCDPDVLREQIAEYLHQAVMNRHEYFVPVHDNAEPNVSETALTVVAPAREVPAPFVEVLPVDESPEVSHRDGSDRRRARRLRGEELPSLWTVKLPWGSAASVIDISKRGALIESPSKVVPGTTFDLQLVAEGTSLYVPARTVRAEVSRIDAQGVRYHIGAAFSRELELAGFESPQRRQGSPRVLVDLLSRVLEDEPAASEYFALRSRFESELRRLLRVRDLQIRETPLVPDRGAESIYFSVPRTSGSQRILQAVFDPGVTPSAEEFRLLRAAAGLAGVLMEFAPSAEPRVS